MKINVIGVAEGNLSMGERSPSSSNKMIEDLRWPLALLETRKKLNERNRKEKHEKLMSPVALEKWKNDLKKEWKKGKGGGVEIAKEERHVMLDTEREK